MTLGYLLLSTHNIEDLISLTGMSIDLMNLLNCLIVRVMTGVISPEQPIIVNLGYSFIPVLILFEKAAHVVVIDIITLLKPAKIIFFIRFDPENLLDIRLALLELLLVDLQVPD